KRLVPLKNSCARLIFRASIQVLGKLYPRLRVRSRRYAPFLIQNDDSPVPDSYQFWPIGRGYLPSTLSGVQTSSDAQMGQYVRIAPPCCRIPGPSWLLMMRSYPSTP